jgi:hypothetical protein
VKLWKAQSVVRGLKPGNEDKQPEARLTTNKNKFLRSVFMNNPVQGQSNQSGVPGVEGVSAVADGTRGDTQSSAKNGVVGTNGGTAAPPAGVPAGNGVFGYSKVPNANGVFGAHDGAGTGVAGFSSNGDGTRGDTASSAKNGVVGTNSGSAPPPPGVPAGNGVYGFSTVPHANGVLGISNGAFCAGVTGISSISVGVHGVNGKGANNPPSVGAGLWGETDGGFGVYGASIANNGIHGDSTNGDAVVGIAHANGKAGVLGLAPNGIGVSAISDNGTGVYGKGSVWAGYFDGKLGVKEDIILANGDCAEDFEVTGADTVGPGTVVVMDQEEVMQASHQAYDKRVAGVIAGAGGCKPGLILGRQQSHPARMPIALMGRVYCKVDAECAPVAVGDLLTTSATPGHAMKAADPLRAFGSVIGKALRPLKAGRGLIPILVALQ